MPEIPDLSKLGKPSAAATDAPPQQAALRVAFTVLVGADGNVVISADTGHEVQQACTHDDIYTACAMIMKDVQVQQTAQVVQRSLLQMGSMMQQAQTDSAIRQHLNLK